MDFSERSTRNLERVRFEIEHPRVIAPEGYRQVRTLRSIDIDKEIVTKCKDRLFSFNWREFKRHPNCIWFQRI